MAEDQGRLTTHVLDTMNGKPGAGMRINFSVQEGDDYRLIKTVQTNADGRTDKPLLAGQEMAVGRYQLVFHVRRMPHASRPGWIAWPTC